MPQVVELVRRQGHGDVWTHINSGNVVFEAPGTRAALEQSLETTFEEELGFEVTTFVRTTAEVRRTLTLQPFVVGPGDTYFVTFLKDSPSKSEARALEALSNDFDTLVVQGRDVHWHMRSKSTDTKLGTKAWDDIVVTTAAPVATRPCSANCWTRSTPGNPGRSVSALDWYSQGARGFYEGASTV